MNIAGIKPMSLVSQALQATALSALSALASCDVVRRVNACPQFESYYLQTFLLFVVSALREEEN